MCVNSAVAVPQIVVLAGGLGTRLGQLGRLCPKSLLEVSGKPMLTHILDWAASQGCERGLILTGHLGEQFDGFRHHTIDLTFQRESVKLGTGGSLWNARDLLDERFFLVWGDDLHMISYSDLLISHLSSGCNLTMTVTRSHSQFNLQYEDGRVLRYDKIGIKKRGLNGYEAGTSVVEKRVVEETGKEGSWSWEEVVYSSMAGSIGAHIDDSPFWDIGTPERLARLQEFLDKGGPTRD